MVCKIRSNNLWTYRSVFWRPELKPKRLNKSVTSWSEQHRHRAQPNLRKGSTDNQCFLLWSQKRTPGLIRWTIIFERRFCSEKCSIMSCRFVLELCHRSLTVQCKKLWTLYPHNGPIRYLNGCTWHSPSADVTHSKKCRLALGAETDFSGHCRLIRRPS